MADKEQRPTIGLLIVSNAAKFEVTVRVVDRRAKAEHPTNPGNYPEDYNGLHLQDLGMFGHVSEFDAFNFLGTEPCYRSPYQIERRDAEAMAKTLRKIGAATEKAAAREDGDVMLAFARAIGATFVCHSAGERRGWSYADWDWRWLTPEEGRNHYRHQIEAMRAEMRKHKEGRAA